MKPSGTTRVDYAVMPNSSEPTGVSGPLLLSAMATVGALLSLGLPFATEYDDDPSGSSYRGRGFTWAGWGLSALSNIDGYHPTFRPVATLLVVLTAVMVALACAALSVGTTGVRAWMTGSGFVLLASTRDLAGALSTSSHDHQVVAGPGYGVWSLAVLVATLGAFVATITNDPGPGPSRPTVPW
jgi:hypothetical protein